MKHILCWLRDGDLLIDATSGSGTLAVRNKKIFKITENQKKNKNAKSIQNHKTLKNLRKSKKHKKTRNKNTNH